jgi:hypothetical protein
MQIINYAPAKKESDETPQRRHEIIAEFQAVTFRQRTILTCAQG